MVAEPHLHLPRSLTKQFPNLYVRAEEAVVWNTSPVRTIEAVRSVYQKITYEDGTEWGVTVAESRRELNSERRAAQNNLASGFWIGRP